MTSWPELATTDLAQIAAWNEENPTTTVVYWLNRACTSFLSLMSRMAWRRLPPRWEAPPSDSCSQVGRGICSLVVQATENSDLLGNRSANLDDGHEWFSFRADRRYVVGPGSIHPNGNLYTVLADGAPTSIPEWVCEWVGKHSQETFRPRKLSQCRRNSTLKSSSPTMASTSSEAETVVHHS